MTGLEDWRQLLADAAGELLEAAARAQPWLAAEPRLLLVAIGSSTVDWERAAMTLGGDGDWQPLARDPLLGASVHRAPGASEPLILLLEPDTEGPLAASLARFGEGPAAIYAHLARPPERKPTVARTARTGPLGAARLLAGPRWGPHVVLLRARATIGR